MVGDTVDGLLATMRGCKWAHLIVMTGVGDEMLTKLHVSRDGPVDQQLEHELRKRHAPRRQTDVKQAQLDKSAFHGHRAGSPLPISRSHHTRSSSLL